MTPDRQSIPSIQGERAATRAAAIWASASDVATYVAGRPDGVLTCRERGRHSYAATRASLVGGPPFTAVTAEGLYVRRLPCDVCRHEPDADGTPGPPRVERVEEWEIRHRRGVILPNGAQLVRAYPHYLDDDYLIPAGQGRVKPRQVRSALISTAVEGRSVIELRREINAAAAARITALRVAAENDTA